MATDDKSTTKAEQENRQEGSRAESTRAAAQAAAGQSGTRAQATRPGDRQGAASTGTADGQSQSGIREQVQAAAEARRTVPGASNVDARLDNRGGRQRPALEEWPAKPQQIDGPDLSTQDEFTRAALQDRRDDETERKGMFSPGPHGLSNVTLRDGGPVGETQVLYGTEGLTEDEMADGQPPTADGGDESGSAKQVPERTEAKSARA